MASSLTLHTKNTFVDLEHLIQQATIFVQQAGASQKALLALELTLEEMITNTIKYGYNDAKEHVIDVQLSLDEEFIHLDIKDDGRMFNPLILPDPNVQTSLEQRTIGGLGILMVKKSVDDIHYTRSHTTNELRIKIRRYKNH